MIYSDNTLSCRLWTLYHVIILTEYRIVGNFQQRKLSQISEKHDFHEENFCGLLAFVMPKDVTSQNFAKKTFVNSYKTMKFTNIFSLESFAFGSLVTFICPLYLDLPVSLYHHILYPSQLLALKVSFLSDCNLFSSRKIISH